jgi:hypothetical protein
VCGLALDTWAVSERVTEENNERLLLTFTEAELDSIVGDMKSATAPGPDGFPTILFKRLWTWLKLGILHILNDFVLGHIDISRLNFGIPALIPKVPGADLVFQFHPNEPDQCCV